MSKLHSWTSVAHNRYSHQKKRVSTIECSHPKCDKPQIKECNLKCGVNWQGALKQKHIRQMGVKRAVVIKKHRKANWIIHDLRRNYTVKCVIQWKADRMRGWGRRCKLPLHGLRKREETGIWRGSTTTHSLENLLWNRLWTCHKTDYKMNEHQ